VTEIFDTFNYFHYILHIYLLLPQKKKVKT